MLSPSLRHKSPLIALLVASVALDGCAHQQQNTISQNTTSLPQPIAVTTPSLSLSSGSPSVGIPTLIKTSKPLRVELKAFVEPVKPIPDRIYSEAEGQKLRWPDTLFRLTYKKGLKNLANIEETHIVHRVWYKALPSAPWRELPEQFRKKFDFRLAGADEGRDTGSGLIAEYALMDVQPGIWKLDMEIIVDFLTTDFSKDDVPSVNYQGHARFTMEANAPQYGRLGNPVELCPRWISHIEWAPTLKGPWKKVPRKGDKGFPLHIQQPFDMYLRAVKLYPKESWPTEGFDASNTGQRLPKWEGRYMGTRIEQPGHPELGDDLFHLQRDALFWNDFVRVQQGNGIVPSSDANLLNITANAGSSEIAQLFIDPLVPASK